MPNFTTEDLIQYLYGETSPEKTLAIKNALNESRELNGKLLILKESLHGLDKILESPRPESIEAILNYAKNSAEIEQH